MFTTIRIPFHPFLRSFRDHPASVGESYWQHMGQAFTFAGLLTWLAMAALVHGLLPSLHQRTVSDRIISLAAEMKARRDGSGAISDG